MGFVALRPPLGGGGGHRWGPAPLDGSPGSAQQFLHHRDQQRDTHGLPGRSNDVYSEMAARGFYQRWADLMSGLSWSDIAALDAVRRANESEPKLAPWEVQDA